MLLQPGVNKYGCHDLRSIGDPFLTGEGKSYLTPTMKQMM